MKVVILCGGKGTRIREASELLPKPMLSVGDRPIVWHIMKIYAHHGITDFVLCLGYQGWKIKEYFLNYHAMSHDLTVDFSDDHSVTYHGQDNEHDWRVTLAETGEASQTGARLWRARKYLEGEEHFCLTYSDGVGDVDIARLMEFHRTQGKVATITAVHPSSRFGELTIEGDLITHFTEKPGVVDEWVNGGFMVFDAKRIWEHLGPSEQLTLEAGVLPKLAESAELAAYRHQGYWHSMDTVHEHTLLNDLWNSNTAPWKIWG